MKKINRLYILIPAVVAIWAMIGYQLYAFLREPENPVYTMPDRPAAKNAIDSIEYTLIADYRDPFLGRKSAVRVNVGGAKVTPKTTSRVGKTDGTLPKPVEWDVFTYMGMIENNSSRSRIALMLRQGNSIIIQEGEMIGQFKVVKIWPDSVRLECQGELKSFYKR
jgi:hypothetical protein